MTAIKFAETLRWLGWNQRFAAEQLGVTEGAVSRWVAGERKIPGPVRLLMSIAVSQEKARKKAKP